MHLCDLLPTQQIIIEWGRRGFPGFGRRMFGQRHYEYMVSQLNDIADEHAKQWLTDWLAEAFQRDNPRFKEDLFKRAVAAKRQYHASPSFEQRHFYYLAELVREIADPAVHEFVRDWLARAVGGTNFKFKQSTWQQHTARQQPMTEQYGLPGFGRRYHEGFGKRFFTAGHYFYIANALHEMRDAMVRDHLAKWFGEAFKLDNPAFDAQTFQTAVLNGARYANPRWQQRHYYYLAHEVAEITDPHEREFVCEWLAKEIGRPNPNFNGERWREYCHLPSANDDRQRVARGRAQVRGETPEPGQESEELA